MSRNEEQWDREGPDPAVLAKYNEAKDRCAIRCLYLFVGMIPPLLICDYVPGRIARLIVCIVLLGWGWIYMSLRTARLNYREATAPPPAVVFHPQGSAAEHGPLYDRELDYPI